MSVLPTEPTPPVSSVPPTTTAAIADNSQPMAPVGEPENESAARKAPANPARAPLMA